MSKRNWQEDNSWPVSQTILSWIVLILFVVLVVDWSEVIVRHREDVEQAIFCGTPEYDKLISDMNELVDSLKQATENGTLTLSQAAEAQIDVVTNGLRIRPQRIAFSHSVEIYEIARDNFMSSWVPAEGTPDDILEYLEKYPQYKEQQISFLFNSEWGRAQNEARISRGLIITTPQLLTFGKWLMKWYWLFTIPSLIIFLLNRKYKKESMVAELLLQPCRLLLACLFGPFGLMMISETAAEAWRYNKFRNEFYAKHGRGPNDQEEQAIRRLVKKPLLQFEQALELARTSGEQISRPLAVCALAWILGLMSQPMLRQVLPSAITQMTVYQADDVKSAGNNDNSFGKNLLLAILPTVVGWQIKETEKGETIAQENVPRDVLWEAVLARGPPPAVEWQSLSMNDSALNCTTQKG